jgi:two-component system chemotaxis response regulator CheY
MSAPLIFTVDDDEVFLTVITQVLKKFGMSTENFTTAQDLLERLQEKTPDLCFVDLNIGTRGSGLDLIQEIRKRLTKPIPLLVVTTETDPVLIANAIEIGADDYIFKPLNREILTAKLLEYVQTHELESSKPVDTFELETDLTTEILAPIEILQIDEIGITVLSPHLFPKGMRLEMKSPFFLEFTQNSDRLTLSVLNSELETSRRDLFRIQLEFDLSNTMLLDQVRTWIEKTNA